MSILRNPISYSIYAIFIFLMLSTSGREPLVVLQHLVLPYTIDISRGVGDDGASIYRAVTFLVQLLVLLFVLLLVKAETKGQRIALSTFGILFVVMYFLMVVFGYVIPRLH